MLSLAEQNDDVVFQSKLSGRFAIISYITVDGEIVYFWEDFPETCCICPSPDEFLSLFKKLD